MMKAPSCFRPVEEWKSALMTLQDSNFFELMRSIFGNIKTPFNKQRLMDDLFALLSREEIRQTIAGYIDKQDHKIIAAVALLREPEHKDLERFFSGELAYAELHSLLLNLEERLILYQVNDGESRRLALNPVLEPVLAPFIAKSGVLFPSQAAKDGDEGKKGPAFIADGRILAALFAFISEEEEFFKTEGGIRKKVIDEGKQFFQSLDLNLAAGALQQLGLFRAEGERFVPETGRIRDFACLNPRERREYWAAGIYLYLTGSGDEGFGLSRNRIQAAASFIRRFCGALDQKRRYPGTTLRRIAEILQQESFSGPGAWRYGLLDAKAQPVFEPLLDALGKTGMLVENGNYWKAPSFSSPGAETAEGAAIVMNSSFSFVLYPEISFADALALSAFCSVTGTTGTSLELTRSSAVRGFNQGIDSEAMMELLKRLSLNRLGDNLEWTLKDWESRYSAVSLHQGVVLTLAGDRRYLAEAEPVASLIRKTLAPGVYLLDADESGEAVAALKKAGVDIIAQPSGQAERKKTPKPNSGVFSAFPSLDGLEAPLFLSGTSPGGTVKKQPAQSIQEKFLTRLKGMRLSKAERDELEARIERRLVLTESQLEGASVKYEKLEARGLDYVGKTVIAKQAIASGSLLEVTWPRPGGGTNTTTGIPSALEKKEGESVLILKPLSQEEDREIRLPLGKISLLRRIKQSIFGE
ncbi:MAG: hypothetical protein LBC62_03720 [Treponema sp.]|jgi:hypothetical protein|nr:hypothetical protein [Treponema sp.]